MTTFALRDCTPTDIGFVYQLRNEIETRKFSENMNPVPVGVIEQMKPLIFTMDGKPIGYGTMTERGKKALLTWNVALQMRNRGYGRQLIKLLIERAGALPPLATIRHDDRASKRTAMAAGMVDQTEREKGKKTIYETWGLDRSQPSGI